MHEEVSEKPQNRRGKWEVKGWEKVWDTVRKRRRGTLNIFPLETQWEHMDILSGGVKE